MTEILVEKVHFILLFRILETAEDLQYFALPELGHKFTTQD